MTAEQKAEWVNKYYDTAICHVSSLENNRIELSGDFSGFSVFGASTYKENTDVANNKVMISNAKIGKSIAGGHSEYGNAVGNKVVLSNVIATSNNQKIYGGLTANGDANSNKVSFDGITFTDNKLDVYGGYSKLGNVSGNVIKIDKSIKHSGSYWNTVKMTAGETLEGDAVNNQIIINDTVFENNELDGSENGFWGGVSEKGDVIGNSVIVDNSNLSDYLVGGTAVNGNALNNSVIISNSDIKAGYIRGADVVTGNGKAENNIVYIDKSNLLNTEVIGSNGRFDDVNGEPYIGEIVNNVVEISDSSICGDFYGGKGEEASLISSNVVKIFGSSNAVEDKDGKFNGAVEIYGGRNGSTGTVQGNSVQIVESTIMLDENYTGIDDNRFYGGYGSGDVKENVLAVNNSNVEGLLIGGSSRSGNVADNVVFISGDGVKSNVKGNIYGGLIKNGVGDATYNKVFIDSSIVTLEPSEELPLLAGGVAKQGAADSNYVAIVNSKVGYGDLIRAKNTGMLVGGAGHSSASENTFVVSGSKINIDIVGGYSSSAGNADSNKVIISDSTVNSIYGGLSIGKGSSADNNKVILNNSNVKSVYGGLALEQGSSADNNVVVINNSTVAGEIAGGAALNGEKANNNTIIISGTSDISEAVIMGGSGKETTNNALVLDGWSGSALEVAGFDKYSLQNIKNLNENGAVLTVDRLKHIDSDTQFDVNFAGSFDLQEDSVIKLIEAEKSYIGFDDKKIESSVGTSLDVDGTISNSGNDVDFTVDKITLNSQTDIVGSANATAMAFMSDGSELAVDGLAQINSDEYGYNTFAATRGINGDYDNNVDLQGWNNIVGVGNNTKTSAGDFAWGVFYEGGTGEYDTTNSYRDFNFGVDGKAVYNGGGVAARLSHDSGLYYEAGLRAGKLKNDVSNALMDANDIAYGYKTESDYFGYHVGVGKAVALENGNQFDIYARYYHTKVDGDSFVVGSGDRYELDKVYSDRIRLGGRYRDNTNEAVKVFYGAAWEYEFSGESEGSTHGYAMDAADLGGSTLIGEIGLLMNNPGSPWTVDMALQGYTGEREGFGGKVQANYHF